MNRRRFLGLLGMASTAYFFAPKGGWTSDVIVNPAIASKCPPRCPDHLHLWQVQEAMKRQEAYMRGLIAEGDRLGCADCQAVAGENQRLHSALTRQIAYYDEQIRLGNYVTKRVIRHEPGRVWAA